MKKIFLFSVLFAIVAASCKKNPGDPSITVTASFPTITFISGNHFAIPKGGTLPSGASIATAYDSFYKVSCPIVVIDSTVHALVPGLYKATATAQNKYGYVSSATYYVAVTDLPNGNLNLAGVYQLSGGGTYFENDISPYVSDYYLMNNFAGDSTGMGSTALFALINDSTIAFTGANYGLTGTLGLAVGDTTISYNGLTYIKN